MIRFKMIGLLLLIALSSACGHRTIIVQPGTVSVVTQPIRGAHLASPDSTGKLIDTTADVPVGAEVRYPKTVVKAIRSNQCRDCARFAQDELKRTYKLSEEDRAATFKREMDKLKKQESECIGEVVTLSTSVSQGPQVGDVIETHSTAGEILPDATSGTVPPSGIMKSER